MAINVTNVVGAAVTGLTTPGYTVLPDIAPSFNGKQWYVSGLTGTQTGVDIHSVSKPFTVAFFKPQVVRPIPAPNPTTGIVRNIPVNTYKMVVRKGAVPYLNQAPQVARITVTIDVPAGTETFEPEELRAMGSFAAGCLTQQVQGVVDAMLTGAI